VRPASPSLADLKASAATEREQTQKEEAKTEQADKKKQDEQVRSVLALLVHKYQY
jgi:hypothetical protein